MNSPDWKLFQISPSGSRPEPPRSIDTQDGVGDRLRAAAFAEIQARDAFNWAASFFEDAPGELREAWTRLAMAEQRHLDWLLRRMSELGIDVQARRVSDQLWLSLRSCKTAQEFALYMANAEERGRRAGERFYEALRQTDSITAEIFRKIAAEEVEHIALAHRYFPSSQPAR